MIAIKDGDLLKAEEDILVHQVNCMGVMESGVAAQIKEKWPQVFIAYKDRVDKMVDIQMRSRLLGEVLWVRTDDGKWIANLFGQYKFGRENKCYTDYSALKRGFMEIAYNAKIKDESIAIPYKIGCGRGGGDWENVVFPMIEEVFSKNRVTIYKPM